MRLTLIVYFIFVRKFSFSIMKRTFKRCFKIIVNKNLIVDEDITSSTLEVSSIMFVLRVLNSISKLNFLLPYSQSCMLCVGHILTIFSESFLSNF